VGGRCEVTTGTFREKTMGAEEKKRCGGIPLCRGKKKQKLRCPGEGAVDEKKRDTAKTRRRKGLKTGWDQRKVGRRKVRIDARDR